MIYTVSIDKDAVIAAVPTSLQIDIAHSLSNRVLKYTHVRATDEHDAVDKATVFLQESLDEPGKWVELEGMVQHAEQMKMIEEHFEKKKIQHVLELLGNNRSNTAAALGIQRKELYRKIKQYGIDNEKDHPSNVIACQFRTGTD